MKSILLPTDFSKNSLNAIKYAVSVFQNIPCNFYLLNVQKASSFISDDMMVVSASTTIYETLISAAKKSIDNVILKIKMKYPTDHHHFHSIVDYDNLVDSINQICAMHNIDLIVMGTKGATGLEKKILGSNTVHVVQRCDVPVLVVPDNYVYSGLDKITFTTSFKNTYSVKELKELKSLLDLNQGNLDVFHILNEQDPALELDKMVDFFNKEFDKVSFKYENSNTKDFFDTIHNYIIESNVKLLAMVNKKHSFLERLLNRHAVETLAFNIDIPFLVIPRDN